MLTDQKESGIIESIADGIARISGLNESFYSELLYTVAINNQISDDLDSDDFDLLTSTNDTPFPSKTAIVLRTVHDLLLPFILFNNPAMLSFFEDVNSSTIDLDSIVLEEIEFEGDAELSFDNSIFASDNNDSLNVDFNLLTNIFDLLIDSNLLDVAENIISIIENEDDIIDASSFAYAYSTLVLNISISIIEKAKNENIISSEIATKLTKATLNYMSLLAESLGTISIISILAPDTNEITHDETISDLDITYNDDEIDEIDESEEELEINELIDDESEEELSKVLLIVMGLEKEYLQAPILTQTTNIFEGDLVWGTGQELEVYCSFESLGRISDIFLNPIE